MYPMLSTHLHRHNYSHMVGYGAQPHYSEEAAPPGTQTPASNDHQVDALVLCVLDDGLTHIRTRCVHGEGGEVGGSGACKLITAAAYWKGQRVGEAAFTPSAAVQTSVLVDRSQSKPESHYCCWGK